MFKQWSKEKFNLFLLSLNFLGFAAGVYLLIWAISDGQKQLNVWLGIIFIITNSLSISHQISNYLSFRKIRKEATYGGSQPPQS